MEAAGLALGIAGLAGLFSACIETARRVDSWKQYGDEWAKQAILFETERLRLERWGKAVNLQQENLSGERDCHKALLDAQTKLLVRELLKLITSVCSEANDSFAPISLSKMKKQSYTEKGNIAGVGLRAPDSKRERLKWALWSEGKIGAQISQLQLLVQKLHEVIPPAQATALTDQHPCEPQSSAMDATELLANMRRDLQMVKNSGEAELKRTIHAWLLEHNLTSDLYDDVLRSKLDGTCDWLFSRFCFCSWASDLPDGRPRLLWLHGPAGFGKTTLSARITQYLPSILNGSPMAFFFFSSATEYRGDPYVALRSWISQLIPNPIAFNAIYDGWQAQYEPNASKKVVLELFRQVVQRVSGCTFILDGLDECTFQAQHSGEEIMSQFFLDLESCLSGSATRMIITSRNEPEIRNNIRHRGGWHLMEYEITPADVSDDLAAFSRSIVDRRLSNKTKAVRLELSEKLTSRSGGQFQWVKMLESTLTKGKNTVSLLKAVQEAPAGLDKLYDRNWDKINAYGKRERTRALSLLRWVVFALRPLTVSQVTHALLVDEETGKVNLDEMPDDIDQDYVDSEMLDLCGSLLTVQDTLPSSDIGSRVLRIPHFSIRVHLCRRMGLEHSVEVVERLSDLALARTCFQYARDPVIWQLEQHISDPSISTTFRDYALCGFFTHFEFSMTQDPEVLAMLYAFLKARGPGFYKWASRLSVLQSGEELGWGVDEVEKLSPLFYESAIWLKTPTLHFQTSSYDANETNSHGISILMTSCRFKDEATIQKLISDGADVLHADSDGSTALHAAAAHNNTAAMKVLLSHGADFGALNLFGSTALDMACALREREAVMWLLGYKARHMPTSTIGAKVFKRAVRRGHYEILEALLVSLASDYRGSALGPLLGLAAAHDRFDIAKLLLQHSSTINLRKVHAESAFYTAARLGHSNIVGLILDHGVPINTLFTDGTALIKAIKRSEMEMAMLLLEHGANVNMAMKNGMTPLIAASRLGNPDIVQELMQRSASAEHTMDGGETALLSAAGCNHPEVLKILLSWGANVNASKHSGQTCLIYAAEHGAVETVQLLLQAGADVNAVGYRELTALHRAILASSVGSAKLLLDAGANIEAADDRKSTALHLAASINLDEVTSNESDNKNTSDNTSREMAGMLLDRGLNPLLRNQYGSNAMHDAAQYGRAGMIALLLERTQLTVESKEYEDRTCLFIACMYDRVDVARELLSRGADVNSLDRHMATPLMTAVRRGNEQTVDLLLRMEQTRIDCRDVRGLTAIDWAVKGRNSRILALLTDKTSERDLEVPANRTALENYNISLEMEEAYCDICTCPISFPSWYRCQDCSGGDFDICTDCFTAGLRCRDASHQWVQRRAKKVKEDSS
ncbi:ankyrin repeat-containing domain protein [Stachybotrys elegans]|uniref:Ankyrin repeat-containing domain protein n=1 Tax=Stachybotrys elegans TaxID=80388 RepID=A0A8K0SAY8_9HYPO|nr:ankyrin repeat-containing domain protein [Stachybotrys elegans]